MSVNSYIVNQASLFDEIQMMSLISPKISNYKNIVSYDIGATDTRVNNFDSISIGCSFSLGTT